MSDDDFAEDVTVAVSGAHLRDQAAAGVFWSSSAMLVQVLLNVVSISILARLLTPSDYGMVTAVVIVIELSATFAAFGLNSALVQRKTLDREHIATAAVVSLGLALFFTLAFWLSAPLIAGWLRIPGLESLIRMLSWISIVQVFVARAEALLARKLRFRLIPLVRLAASLSGTFLVAIPGALLGYGYKALIAGSVTQLLLSAILYGFFDREDLVRPRFCMRAFKDLAAIGAGFSATELFNYIASYSDNIAVGRTLGPASLAIYARAYQLISIPTALITNVGRHVVFPAMARVQNEPANLRAAMLTGLSLVAVVTLPGSAFLIVFARELIGILLGKTWLAVATPFMVFGGVIYFRVAYKAAATVLQARGRAFILSGLQGGYALLIAVGATLAAPHGLTAVSMAVAGTIALSFVVCLALAMPEAGASVGDMVEVHVRPVLAASAVVAIGLMVKAALVDVGSIFQVAVAAILCMVVLGGTLWFRPSLLFGPRRAAAIVSMFEPLTGRLGWGAR